MEAKRLEAKLCQENELRRPKVETTEEGEGSRTGAPEEEEARDKDGKEERNEGTTTSGEDIDRPDKDAERDDNVSDGDKDVDGDAVRGSGGSEADKW